DPLVTGAVAYRADPTATISTLAGMVGPAPAGWAETWVEAARVADRAAAEAIAVEAFPSEPAVARIVATAAPDASLIYAGSSMPIRDLDSFGGPPRTVPVLANRGANGIDGLLSAAAGASIEAGRVVCLSGDIGAIHDLNALVTIARNRLPVTTVVVNNDGGGIFHFLPHADPAQLEPGLFERLFGTGHGLAVAPVAEAMGIPTMPVAGPDDLAAALQAPGDGPLLVEVRTDRAENVAVHRRIRDAVAAALR
ncbi:MAG: 2-succinyl-5-enolpyruvyl-6-hydroxy-3-cyclohexene-1-carboxylate synthase, partial [Actinobacteria bacterium]